MLVEAARRRRCRVGPAPGEPPAEARRARRLRGRVRTRSSRRAEDRFFLLRFHGAGGLVDCSSATAKYRCRPISRVPGTPTTRCATRRLRARARCGGRPPPACTSTTRCSPRSPRAVGGAYVTLHVARTFQPVTTEDLSAARMHSERYAIPERRRRRSRRRVRVAARPRGRHDDAAGTRVGGRRIGRNPRRRGPRLHFSSRQASASGGRPPAHQLPPARSTLSCWCRPSPVSTRSGAAYAHRRSRTLPLLHYATRCCCAGPAPATARRTAGPPGKLPRATNPSLSEPRNDALRSPRHRRPRAPRAPCARSRPRSRHPSSCRSEPTAASRLWRRTSFWNSRADRVGNTFHLWLRPARRW